MQSNSWSSSINLEEILTFLGTHNLATLTLTLMLIIGGVLLIWGFREIATWFFKLNKIQSELKDIKVNLIRNNQQLRKILETSQVEKTEAKPSTAPIKEFQVEEKTENSDSGFTLTH